MKARRLRQAGGAPGVQSAFLHVERRRLAMSGVTSVCIVGDGGYLPRDPAIETGDLMRNTMRDRCNLILALMGLSEYRRAR